MSTSQETIDRLTEMLGDGSYVFKRMFGEYALYVDGKVVALVCDDQLFIKPSSADEAFRADCKAAPPYPGAKDYWQPPERKVNNRAWLKEALAATAAALPPPKPRKKR